jgi:hypothetical protein
MACRRVSLNFIFLSFQVFLDLTFTFFVYFFGGLERVGHPFAYVAHFVFLINFWIRTQRDVVSSRRATNLATHLPFDMYGTVPGT